MAKPPSFAQHRLPQGPSLVFLSQFSDSRMTSGGGLPVLPALSSGEAHDNRLERHRLLAHGETARASGQPACEGHQRKTSSAALRKLDVSKVLSGGGGIYSTAPDYLTLLQALLNGGCLRETGILRPETVALMSENQIGNLEVGILKTTNPALSNDVHFFRTFGCDGDLDT
jgi:CubicO group peptidase (beta-lactamase class C family)